VLGKQERKNKLSKAFGPKPYNVVTKSGNTIVIQSPEGDHLMQNTSKARKFGIKTLLIPARHW